MKICIGPTAGVTTYTLASPATSIKLLYIGSYTVSSVTSLYWIAV
jgi:hypothetical protein